MGFAPRAGCLSERAEAALTRSNRAFANLAMRCNDEGRPGGRPSQFPYGAEVAEVLKLSP